jgi:deoxycytidine triphosphate deaminase
MDEQRSRSLAEQHRYVDPLPEIAPALLGAAEIEAYVNAAGLIFPFDRTRLKGASYPLVLDGRILRSDDGKKWTHMESAELRSVDLASNSLIYVTVSPAIQLPTYIAARFNLKIRQVYRGLVAGTGPLVDPGWRGRLSLPLHNLSSVDYSLMHGEELIWMEFTKLAPSYNLAHGLTHGNAPRIDREFHENGSVLAYVMDASPTPIRSALPHAIQATEQAVRNVRRFAIAGAVAISIAVVGTIVGVLEWTEQVNQTTQGDLQTSNQQIANLQERVSSLESQLASLRASPHAAAQTSSPSRAAP